MKIKNCPFCGGPAYLTGVTLYDQYFGERVTGVQVECGHCSARTAWRPAKSADDMELDERSTVSASMVVGDWNRRVCEEG